ncbi:MULTISPECIES: hypothetical protein [Leptolyngbya]|uniref:hypothetical protein n=1 Tax=Leptolyngbya TaxID=47251 RepID=UPI001689B93F|nr:hypothetical protein [Leptolyngbya sp. FACHB-1624]MBD1858298.1 hypothetical protein [Leptolyngbya sp. FACHB-1624]
MTKLRTPSWANKLFYLLVLTDLGFILLHFLVFIYSSRQWSPTSDVHFYSVERDRGMPEFFQYTKEFWCVLILGFIALRKRVLTYLSWMFLFLYLLLDDSLSIHENLGLYVGNQLGFTTLFGLRSADYGEILVSGVIGLCLLAGIGFAYRMGDQVFRKSSKVLIKSLLALVVFGIVTDTIHIVTPDQFNKMIGLLEDGGEMLVMSAMTAFIFMLPEQVQQHNLNLTSVATLPPRVVELESQDRSVKR